MNKSPHLTRRLFLGTSAAALVPGSVVAQTAGPSQIEFASACRALSGFDAIPEALVTGASRALPAAKQQALIDSAAGTDLQKMLLKILYTGRSYPDDTDPERFAYEQALMHAAVEDSLNVPSYCGGVPGYWAEKPVNA